MGIVVQGPGYVNKTQESRDVKGYRTTTTKKLAEQQTAEALEAEKCATAARKAEEERRAREKRIAELDVQIEGVEKQIQELKDKKLQYENMRSKIAEAQDALRSADSKVIEAQDTLSTALTGNKGKETREMLTTSTTEINQNINELEIIAGAIQPHIKRLREGIEALDIHRRELRAEIDRLR